MRIRFLAIISLVLGLSVTAAAQQTTALRTGWAIQSSCKVAEKGGVISTPGFTPKGWYPATVPSTVLAALTADKVFPDPFFGMNLRAIPGTSYPDRPASSRACPCPTTARIGARGGTARSFAHREGRAACSTCTSAASTTARTCG